MIKANNKIVKDIKKKYPLHKFREKYPQLTINYDSIMTELIWGTDVYNGKSPTCDQFMNPNSKYNKQLKKLGKL